MCKVFFRGRWHPLEWSKCSGCKNKPGTKSRTVECIKEAPTSELDPEIVDESLCTGVKPKTQQMCCSEKPCPPNINDQKDEVHTKIAHLGPQLQRIRPNMFKKKKVSIKKVNTKKESIKRAGYTFQTKKKHVTNHDNKTNNIYF